MTDWNAVSAFMNAVVAWPGVQDPGYVNLHYSMVNPKPTPGKNFSRGWAGRSGPSMVSSSARRGSGTRATSRRLVLHQPAVPDGAEYQGEAQGEALRCECAGSQGYLDRLGCRPGRPWEIPRRSSRLLGLCSSSRRRPGSRRPAPWWPAAQACTSTGSVMSRSTALRGRSTPRACAARSRRRALNATRG